MKEKEKYRTRQKDLLLRLVRRQRGEFSVREICEKAEGAVSLTTAYRIVEELAESGLLTRAVKENNTVYYRYLRPCHEPGHFYLKCERCNKVTHVDCGYAHRLAEHLTEEHGFFPSGQHVMISGVCESCMGAA